MHQNDSFGSALKRGYLRMPVVIRTLITINVAVFMVMAIGGQTVAGIIADLFKFIPDPFTAATQPWRFITYMFVHGSGFHLIFNMLWLWWMGRAVEESIGPRTFSVIYFGAGLGGILLQFALAAVFGANPVIGASGAVYGIMVAFGFLFPRTPIMLIFLPPIEARFVVAGIIVLDFLLLGSGDNVARLAHLGGAGAGYLLVNAHYTGYDLSNVIRPFERLWTKPPKKEKKRKKNDKMYSVSDVEVVDESNQSELDEILEKISKKGYDGLTPEEKRKLFELSKKN